MEFLKVVFLLFCVVSSVGLITYLERRILALVQLRKGPDVVGWHGILQPVADCFKLLNKQILWPRSVDKFLFMLAPFLAILFPLLICCFLPFCENGGLVKNDFSLVIVLGLSLIGSLGECLPGLIVNSTYQRFGSHRAIIQIISYEICLGLCVLNIGILANGFSFESVLKAQENVWFCFLLPHVALAYFIASLAACNRTPFDTLEAEQELIAGYHTEYSSILFCVFYMSEYTNILLSSLLMAILFIGGCNPLWGINCVLGTVWLIGKTVFVMFFVLLVRAVWPRYRFYEIIGKFWCICIPVLLLSAIGVEAMLLLVNGASAPA